MVVLGGKEDRTTEHNLTGTSPDPQAGHLNRRKAFRESEAL